MSGKRIAAAVLFLAGCIFGTTLVRMHGATTAETDRAADGSFKSVKFERKYDISLWELWGGIMVSYGIMHGAIWLWKTGAPPKSASTEAKPARSCCIQIDGIVRGPYSSEKIQEFVRRGKVTPDTLVVIGESGEWVRAGRIKGLQGQFDGQEPTGKPDRRDRAKTAEDAQLKVERELYEMEVQMLVEHCGISLAEAKQMASEAIAMCKQQSKAEGTSGLPENFGDRMIEAARMGEPKSKRIVGKARRDGATDDDIKEWWNLPDVGRRMVILSEDRFRLSVFRHAMDEGGLSAEDAADRVKRMYPLYGDPEDVSKLSGDDRPLPHELRGRVDSFRELRSAAYIANQAEGFSSYNAFVRHAVGSGLI